MSYRKKIKLVLLIGIVSTIFASFLFTNMVSAEKLYGSEDLTSELNREYPRAWGLIYRNRIRHNHPIIPVPPARPPTTINPPEFPIAIPDIINPMPKNPPIIGLPPILA